MEEKDSKSQVAPMVVTSPRDFFEELISEGLSRCRLEPSVAVRSYLVDLLESYMLTDNLREQPDEKTGQRTETLAERFLLAVNADMPERMLRLKRVGDLALYIGGFFGDSLQRKVVDLDYYAEIGGSAYSTAAGCVQNEAQSLVFQDLSENFFSYLDVLTFVSQQSFVQSDQDLLKLYGKYLSTGSQLAREQLLSQGVLAVLDLPKARRQQ